MLRAVIVDDEEHCRITLINAVKNYCPEISIVAEADSVNTAVIAINNFNPDLVFLDVQLNDGTGFDILQKINKISFKTIFVTGSEQYALKALKFSATDYLLKPVDADDLIEAVAKVATKDKIDEISFKLEALIANKNTIQKIALPSSDGIRLIKVEDIIRCEADSNYTYFYTVSKEKIVVTRTLKEYDELLSPMNFFRVHQSHLINIAHVTRYIKGEGGSVIMNDNTEIEVARRRKEEFLEALLKK